jgi:hypothetical protein
MIERIAAALNVESYRLFQNEPVKTGTDDRRLTPVQSIQSGERDGSYINEWLSGVEGEC